MAGLYLGGKLVTPVIEKKVEVAKTKFGASVDSFLGEVVDGKYIAPESDEVITFSGLTSVADSGFANCFIGYNGRFSFPDVIEVSSYSFSHTWENYTRNLSVSFDKLEEINSARCFQYAFKKSTQISTGTNSDFFFPSLRKINAQYAFSNAFPAGAYKVFDAIFPVLEYVAGDRALEYYMGGAFYAEYASNLKTVVGATSSSYSPFRNSSSSSTFVHNWFFPRATNVSGYITAPYGSVPCVSHFAIANQAAIEACDGYDYKFGATEIYFDLVLDITVNGVVYSRKHNCAAKDNYGNILSVYTLWEDSSGDAVYTYCCKPNMSNSYEEPAVGTVVYSDLGITQVGTVEGVA